MKKEVKIALILAGVLIVGLVGYKMYSNKKKVSDLNTGSTSTRPGAFADKPKSETAAQQISKVV